MGESIGVTLHVLVPAKWKGEDESWPGVISEVADHLCSWSGPDDAAAGPGFVAVTMMGDANYGLSGMMHDGYLDELTKRRIPWEGQGDAKYEYEAEWMLYDGNPDGKVLSGLPSGQDGPLVMTADTYHAINLGEHEWARTHWEFFHCQPGLPDTAPWLLDAPHPDDEDAVDDELAVL